MLRLAAVGVRRLRLPAVEIRQLRLPAVEIRQLRLPYVEIRQRRLADQLIDWFVSPEGDCVNGLFHLRMIV